MRKEVSILAFPVRLPTKRNYKAMKSGKEVAADVVHAIPVASLGLSPILFGVTNHSGIFGAWFCTTRTPKLLTWLKNVLIRHTFVLKFVKNESATKELHINQAKANFNSGFDIIFQNIDSKLERRYMR